MVVARSHTPKGQRAREHILATAEAEFAERGFHGASMRDLAAAADLPLATLVYHFARKEQLYAAVLATIAEQLDRDLAGALAPRESGRGRDLAADAVDAFVRALVGWATREPRRVRLLLRELLDNPTRVEKAAKLPLAPFLTRTTELVAAAVRAGVAEADAPELAVLQTVGAVSYVVASRPTVDRIVGKARAKQLDAQLEREAIAYARRALGMEVRRAR
jgi:AcrR family transcriptional regulator